jgi:hypothetical protein
MSFWTDIRNTALAPINAVGGFASDVINGRNIFEGTADLVTKTLASNYGWQSLTINSTGLDKPLKSLDAYTLGISGDAVDVARVDQRLSNGEKVKKDEILDTYKTGGVDGAILAAAYFTGGAAAGAVGGSSSGAAAVAGGFAGGKAAKGFLNTGDPGQLVQGAASYFGAPEVPQDYKDAYNSAKDAYNYGKQANSNNSPPPPSSQGYFSTQSGFDSGAAPSAIGVVPFVIVGAALLIAGMRNHK